MQLPTTKIQLWTFDYQYIDELDPASIESLEKKYKIHPLDIEDILTDTQLSKLEARNNYIFVAFQLPYFNKTIQNIVEKEIFFIVSNDFFLIINKNKFNIAEQFNNIAASILPPSTQSVDFFYEVLDYLVTSTYGFIPRFKSEISIVETSIFENSNSDKIHEIQLLKRNLINFSSLMKPIEITLLELLNNKFNHEYFNQDTHFEKIDDALDKVKKMVLLSNNFKEQLKMLSESNESLTSRSTNEAIKTLTSISMIILIPNIITSFFGMNVYFGWGLENNFIPFLIILGMIIVSISLTVWVLIKKKLL